MISLTKVFVLLCIVAPEHRLFIVATLKILFWQNLKVFILAFVAYIWFYMKGFNQATFQHVVYPRFQLTVLSNYKPGVSVECAQADTTKDTIQPLGTRFTENTTTRNDKKPPRSAFNLFYRYITCAQLSPPPSPSASQCERSYKFQKLIIFRAFSADSKDKSISLKSVNCWNNCYQLHFLAASEEMTHVDNRFWKDSKLNQL